MWGDVARFAAAHPWWATFLGLWAGAIIFGLGCDIVRFLRGDGENSLAALEGGPAWDEDEV